MATNGSFELRVEMSGLCLFAVDATRPKVAVLMPDARVHDRKRGVTTPDGEVAKAHVGYVRFDLANIDSGAIGAQLPPNRNVTPDFEVVHLLDFEEVQFGLDGESGPLENRLDVPDFDTFASGLELDPAYLTPQPSPKLLARSFLRGGRVESTMIQNVEWRIEALDDPTRVVASQPFGSQTWWTRTVQGHSLTVRIAKFDGSQVVDVPLKPTLDEDGISAITIKMSNLCAKNPLEWDMLEEATINSADVDFKWLYALLRRKGGGRADLPTILPHPKPENSTKESMLQDCFPGRISAGL
jgi:hypothetical protein